MPWLVTYPDTESADFESLTIDGTNNSLTDAKLSPTTGANAGKSAKAIFVSIETADVRVRYDGGDASVDGHLYEAPAELTLSGYNNLKNLRMSAPGLSATAKVTYLY
jgi:hypothetical protein